MDDPAQVMVALGVFGTMATAVAVEVERIGEGQRFTTRLLSERGSDRAMPADVSQRPA